MKNKQNIGVVILAAGKGTRLGCVDRPKVMLELNGRPMVDYTVETLEQMGFSRENIILVVGFFKEKVKEYFGTRVSYVDQLELRGTADAAYLGMRALSEEIDTVLVIQGDDSAFYKPETLTKLIQEHQDHDAVLTLLSVSIPDPTAYGRVVHRDDGTFEIIEKEYVTEEQKKIHEVSTGTFCFKRAWFETMFPTMPVMRKLQEFVLPTAVAMARISGLGHRVVQLSDPTEWYGINTPEELAQARLRKENN